MTIQDDPNDDVFSEAQRSSLKQAFQKMNTQLGVDAYDVEKQRQILNGRLDQIAAPQPIDLKAYGVISRLMNGFSGPWFTAAIASFGIGLAVSRIFFIAEPLQVTNVNISGGTEKNVQSVSIDNVSNGVMEAAQSLSNKLATQPLEINIQPLDMNDERNKLIGAALQAGLTIQISGSINRIAVRIDGFKADEPNQRTFKTLFKVSQGIEGSIIFTLTKQ